MPLVTLPHTLLNGRQTTAPLTGSSAGTYTNVQLVDTETGAVLETRSGPFVMGSSNEGLINLQFYGDSLTYGSTSSNPATKAYPAVLKTILDPTIYNVDTIGVGNPYGRAGRNTQDMITEIMEPIFSNAPGAQSAYVAGVTNIALTMLGTNDATGGFPIADISSRFDQIFSGFKGFGWEKLMQIAPGFHQTNGDETDEALSTHNMWAIRQDILNRANARQINKVIDLLTVARNTLGLYNPTYWNSDRVHYNDAGYALLAQIIKDQLATV